MANRIQLVIDQWSANPKRLFLVDGIGAFLTAFLLVALLVPLQAHFGMPRPVLYSLSAVAWLFTVYSFGCYFFVARNRRPFLRLIAVANLLYCCSTLALVVYYYPRLTVLGVLYFLAEVALVAVLILIEGKAVSRLAHRRDG